MRRGCGDIRKVGQVRHACGDELRDVWSEAREDVGITHTAIVGADIG